MNYFLSLSFITMLSLAFVGGTDLASYVNSAKFAVDEINKAQIATAVEIYYLDHNHYPAAGNGLQLLNLLQMEGYIENQPDNPAIYFYRTTNEAQNFTLTTTSAINNKTFLANDNEKLLN